MTDQPRPPRTWEELLLSHPINPRQPKIDQQSPGIPNHAPREGGNTYPQPTQAERELSQFLQDIIDLRNNH